MTDLSRIVYTAHSKQFFYCRDVICEFVLREGKVPLNPFRMFDYFLNDRVDRDTIRAANNSIIEKADEVWVFGTEIANGVFKEILLATAVHKLVRFFTIGSQLSEITEVSVKDLTFETELLESYPGGRTQLLSTILNSL